MSDVPPDNYALIAQPTEARALVLVGADGAGDADAWALPSLSTDDPPAIAAELRRTLGLDATVLERVWERRPPSHLQGHAELPANEPPSRIYAIEPVRGTDWRPPEGARWVDSNELASLRVANDEHAAPVATWLDERARGVPLQRVPWAIPGWRDEALAWAFDACERAGHHVTGSPAQIKVSTWSTVWRIPIEAGGRRLYFKAAHPDQTYEAPLTHLLAQRLAPRVPRVPAIDADRGWLLIEDGGRSIRARAIAERTPNLAAAYLPELVRLQHAATPYVEKFLASGCPDFRLAALPARFAALVADPDMLLVGKPGGTPEDEYAQLVAMAPEVSAICARLAAYGIPETLHHDDLGPGNVLESPSGGFVFFDWAESAVTHPFCTMMIPLRWARIVQQCDDAALDTLRDAYLAPWADYGSHEDLRAALGLAHRLGYLCRALTYADLLAATEPRVRWEFADGPAYWLRLFLRDDPPGGDLPDMA